MSTSSEVDGLNPLGLLLPLISGLPCRYSRFSFIPVNSHGSRDRRASTHPENLFQSITLPPPRIRHARPHLRCSDRSLLHIHGVQGSILRVELIFPPEMSAFLPPCSLGDISLSVPIRIDMSPRIGIPVLLLFLAVD